MYVMGQNKGVMLERGLSERIVFDEEGDRERK